MMCYGLANLDKHVLYTQIPIPIRQHRKLEVIHFSVDLINERQVHSRYELNFRSSIGITRATGDLEAVDAILVYGLHDQR